MTDWTIQSRPVAPTERKPRENSATWGNRSNWRWRWGRDAAIVPVVVFTVYVEGRKK